MDGMSDGGRSGAESWDMSSTTEKAPKPLGFLSNPSFYHDSQNIFEHMKDELVSVQVALDGTFALDAAPHQRVPVADTSHHTSDAPTDPVVHALRSARLLSSSSTSE